MFCPSIDNPTLTAEGLNPEPVIFTEVPLGPEEVDKVILAPAACAIGKAKTSPDINSRTSRKPDSIFSRLLNLEDLVSTDAVFPKIVFIYSSYRA